MRINGPGSTRGATLLITLIAVAVFALLGVVVYRINQFQAREVIYQKRLAQAHYIAEAGLEDAFHALYADPGWQAGFNKKPFGEGYYTVTVSTDLYPLVRSTGYSANIPLFGRAVKTVSAVASLSYSTAPLPGGGYAIAANDGVSVKSTIDAYNPSVSLTPTRFYFGGSIWANKSFQTSAGALVRGNVFYYKISNNVSNTVQGSVIQTTYTITLPVNYCSTCAASNNNSTGISGPVSCYNSSKMLLTVNSGVTCTLSPGVYYFKGITVDGTLNVNTASGTVTVNFTGDLAANTGCAINNSSKIPARFRIYGGGGTGGKNYVISCAVPLHAYLEDPTSDWNINSELYGRMVGRNITAFQTANIHTDTADLSSPVMTVRWSTGSWTQSYKRQ